MKFKLSPRIALVIIAAVFFLPLALAWLMYTGTIEFQPHATRNLGHLVQPAVPVDWANVSLDDSGKQPVGSAFARHWLILHAVPSPCNESCLQQVTDLRQVHRASGRQQSRIRLALLHDFEDAEDAAALKDIYAEFKLLENPNGNLWRALDQVAKRSEPAATARSSTYLIDPLGNIMLFYAAGYDPNDLKSDLKRLLTWSKLDEQS
jgi:peroxiredoxin